jgi:hypothetical protein
MTNRKQRHTFKIYCIIILAAKLQVWHFDASAQTFTKGNLIYTNSLSNEADTTGWIMEGKGKIEFNDGWMQMFAPNKKGHAVFWCPKEFPNNFIAEWDVQNLHVASGLCIVFFAAKGIHGEDIFCSSIAKRDGTFKQYTKGDINNYHISYYANSKNEQGREIANLRKNKGFYKVQSKERGIPIKSDATYHIQLIKQEGKLLMFIDERKVIDWLDDGQQFGKILEGGKIGFREMKTTQFAYRNFNVWECTSTP